MSKLDHEYDFEGFDVRHVVGAPEARSPRTAQTLLGGLCLAGLVMFVFLSNLLVQEARGLPPGNIEDRIVEYSQSWHDRMIKFEMDRPVAMTRETIEQWQFLSWDEANCMIFKLAQTESGDTDGDQSGWLGFTCQK